jgi:hypothetical protein
MDFTPAKLFFYTLAFVGGWLVFSLVFAASIGEPHNWGTIPGFLGAVFAILLISGAVFVVLLVISYFAKRFSRTPKALSLIVLILAVPAVVLGLLTYAAIFL